MGEAEIWFSSSNSSVAVHWTTLLHYILVDLKVDFGPNTSFEGRSKASGGTPYAHAALRITESID